MSEDNKNLEFEEESDSTEKSVPIGDIYKYTNKGKVHEFNLGLLTSQERKKFDKMSNKEKQRFIASVELQQMPSMFDEISLKSVVYPDPDSNIADVQAAAAKYNELAKLEEDPKFKQMVQGYLKFKEVQDYIIKYCPHISKNDIDLLIKLKPDITVYQFINYYKNIMNDKNLVELNNIQKQLKNPYSDDILKEVLNSGEQLSKNILQLIVNKDIGKLKEIKTIMYYVANVKHPDPNQRYIITDEIANIIGIPVSVEYSKYSPQQYKKFHTLYNVISNLINDVEERCKTLEKNLEDVGLDVKKGELFNNIMCEKDVYEALEKYIHERMWKEAIMNIPGIGMNLDNPSNKTNIKNENESRTQEEKDKKDKERKERLEEKQKKDEEMRKQYEQTMPRDEGKINVEPIDTENEAIEDDISSSINPSTYPVLSEDVINEINDEKIPQIINFDSTERFIPKLKPLDEARNELWNAIYKRNKEIENECNKSGEKYLKPGYIIGIQPASGSLIHLFIRYKSNNKLKSYDYDKSKMYEAIKAAVKNSENLDLVMKATEGPQSSKRITVGKYLNQSIIDAMKKAIELGGSIFSRIKNTFKAPDEIKETKMKLSELSERTIQNNKSLRELEKTIEELTNRVNELSKQVGKSYVDRKISKPSFLDDITKPQSLKPVEQRERQPPLPQENPDSMEEQMRRKLEERRKDIEPDYSEESEEEWGEGIGGKIKIESSDAKKPIPMSDFFKKYL